ncbi:MAG: hypothetical protein KKB50_02935 [Planctomycetes bacterium]|nr:hypothetical protein [Planctomycetota bacterium]
MPHSAWRIACVTGIGLAIVGGAAAQGPLDLIPAESVLGWYARPLPDKAAPSEGPSALQTILDLGTRIAGRPLDSRAQLTARLLEAFGLTVHYPHAIALVDARAKPIAEGAEGRQVDQLRCVLVVQTQKQSDPFRRIIQKVVNEQTDSQVATLGRKKAGSARYQELRDKRLPEWCVIAWGEIGEYFVLTVGDGVWPLVASVARGEAPSLSRDAWMAEVRHQPGHPTSARADGNGPPLLELFVDAQGIRERLDPFVNGRATAFFRGWEAEAMERGHWALGYEQRALYCVGNFLIEGQTRTRVYADPGLRSAPLLETIPEESRYAVFEVPLGDLIRRLVSGWYATRSPEVRESAAQAWERIKHARGIDPERDILAHLGEHAILHNDPPHPLHIPVAVTILVEIRDEPALVHKTLDSLCAAWQEQVERVADETGVPNPNSVQRDDDGVWYLQFGPIAGPAWIATDKFIIASWSPLALRSYLEKLGDVVGRSPSGK